VPRRFVVNGDEAILGAEPDDILKPHVWEGEDDHVIFWMLSLTPTQRVQVAQEFVDGVVMLRNGLRLRSFS